MAKNIQNKNQTGKAAALPLDPNELKSAVRDVLGNMEIPQRAAFIAELEAEMRRIHLDIRAYLVPLGIIGRVPEDLTPTEVGHLIRFLKLNVPQAMRAVEKAVTRSGLFVEGSRRDKLAA